MNLLVWVCVVQAAWSSAFGLYFTGQKEVFRPPPGLQNDSYFGYSITYDEFHKTLVVSAPRADDIGQVYDCNITTRSCIAIARNITRVSEDYKHDYWFGATVKAGRDSVMMCAPRYTEYTHSEDGVGFDAYVTQGRCYTRIGGTDGELIPRRTIEDEIRYRDSERPMEATMDSFGWSIDVSPDDSIIVGGPGMFHGRAMVYDRPEVFTPPKLIRYSNRVTPEFNFGYAVASGVFSNTYLSYAIGSPFGYGEVLFYRGISYLRKLEKTMDTKLVGSMFGAVLCAAKLLGRKTDLLVGAPTYATKKTYNQGAVYIYLGLYMNDAPKFKRRIVGPVSGSMFGSAIITVGDLNGDKRHEIAIGAPFENEHGVVYLYSGHQLISEQLTTLTPLQKIEPEANYGRSFGMSLTPLLDYDQNGCSEIAIGSPYSDSVLLLRCMASVVVKTVATFPNVQGRNSTGKTDFEFEVCLFVRYPRYPEKITALVSTIVEMEHRHARLNTSDGTGRISFDSHLDSKEPKYCEFIPFILPLNGKYETEIGYTITSKLQNNPMDLKEFDPSRVILSDRSILEVRESLWAAECAGNKTCIPDLTLIPRISFQNDSHPYIIGSTNKETIQVTISNHGEVAYESCVRVLIEGVNVIQAGGCVYESITDVNIMMCEPPKPLWKGEKWTTGLIELEMNHLTNLNKAINVTMSLYNRCSNVSTFNTSNSVPVKADPNGIIVKGETDIGSIVNMTEEDIKVNGKKLKQIYRIMNKGPTNWVGLPVQVLLHLHPYISYDNVSVFYSTTNLNIDCALTSQDEKTMSYLCQVDGLVTKLEFVEILIPMSVVAGTLEGLLDSDKNVTVMSSIKLLLIDDEFRTERLVTTIAFLEAAVPIDTIIIGVVVGLCILIIIAVILYKVGFLRRKKKKDLQKLRKSIRRQTVLRRTTMPSQTPGTSDRKQILEGMMEEDENDH